MKKVNIEIILLLLSLFLFLIAGCKTDPVIPTGGLPTEPPVQDPGDENLCENGTISFQHQVLPIMVSACAYSGCHDVATAEEGVVLNNYENVMKEVTPGNPNDSELYESITDIEYDIMPPPPADLLTTEQIGIIRDWILQGAENTTCGTSCDSTATSFSVNIFPMLQTYCVGCHNSNRTDGNVNIENYETIIPYIQNGALLGSIKHDVLYAAMPPSGSILSTCKVAQIEKWINEGALNN